MTMVSSGEISIGGSATSGGLNRSINIELGRSATATSSLNEAALRTLAGVPSGAISLSNFYGKSNLPAPKAIVVVHGTSPRVTAYAWSTSGFGTKFSDPSTLPTGDGSSVAVLADSSAVAVSHNNSPYISVYPWTSSGFGTKYSNPASLPNGSGGVSFSPDKGTLAIAHFNPRYVSVYPWSSSGFGTRFTNPVTFITTYGNAPPAFPPDSSRIIFHQGFNNIETWAWSSSTGWGSLVADQSVPIGIVRQYAMHPAGTALAMAGQYSNQMGSEAVFAWSSSGIGSQYPAPSSPPPSGTGGITYGVDFNYDGSAIAYAGNGAPTIWAYPWSSSGYGAKFADPSTLPSSSLSRKLAFGPNNTTIAVATNVFSESLVVYAWSNSGFGTKYAAPSVSPAGTALDVKWLTV